MSKIQHFLKITENNDNISKIDICQLIHLVFGFLDNTHGDTPDNTSARHEGQLMSDGGAYSPFRSILLVLTHDFIITCVYGPTSSDGKTLRCAPFLCHLR